MTSTPRRALAATAAALLCSLSACGSTEDGAPQPNSTVVPEAAGGVPGHAFTPDPTLVDPRPLSPMSWSRGKGDTVVLAFQAGNPECYGIDAKTVETAEAVTVTLTTGTRADAQGKMCTMNLVFGTTTVNLKSPLGSREVRSTA
ncbi:hypothetical protein [Nocardia thailandica]|uniref:hypothetical protein n=1 Tax=Nocardia thailandica TaxID=257275 RepID=UPI0005BAF36A|nr:hypothetical protein [Nocardia thailandica]